MTAQDEAETVHSIVAIHNDMQDRLRRKVWQPRSPEDALAAYMARLLQAMRVGNDA